MRLKECVSRYSDCGGPYGALGQKAGRVARRLRMLGNSWQNRRPPVSLHPTGIHNEDPDIPEP